MEQRASHMKSDRADTQWGRHAGRVEEQRRAIAVVVSPLDVSACLNRHSQLPQRRSSVRRRDERNGYRRWRRHPQLGWRANPNTDNNSRHTQWMNYYSHHAPRTSMHVRLQHTRPLRCHTQPCSLWCERSQHQEAADQAHGSSHSQRQGDRLGRCVGGGQNQGTGESRARVVSQRSDGG